MSRISLWAVAWAIAALCEAQTVSVSGQVKYRNQPIAGAVITITGPGGLSWRIRSDDEGKYVADHLPVGTYEVSATAPGFDPVSIQITLTDFGVRRVDIEFDRLGPSTSAPPPAPPRPAPPRPAPRPEPPPAPSPPGPVPDFVPPAPGAYWNSWFRRSGANAESMVAEVEKTYDVVFDLSAYNYRDLGKAGAESTTVDPDMREALRAAESELHIVIKPFLIGAVLQPIGGRFDSSADVVPLDKLRKPPTTGWSRDDSLPKLSRSLSAFSKTYGVKTLSPGCGVVGISIWNETTNTPLDYVLRSIPVGIDAASCNISVSPQAGRLLLLRDVPARRIADSALHLFEIKVGNAQPVATAIYMSKRSQPKTYAWKLTSPVSLQFSAASQFPMELRSARCREGGRCDYSGLGERLRQFLFTGADVDGPAAAAIASPERCASATEPRGQAEEALCDLQSLVAAGPTPTFLVRFVKVDGTSRFLPIGTMAMPGPKLLSQAVTLIQPLPSELYSEPEPCISKWTFVLPDPLQNVDADHLTPVGRLPEGTIRTWEAFEASMTTATGRGAAAPKAGEGLLLLAHQDGGKVRFSLDNPEQWISAVQVKPHKFGKGSVAVFASCAVGEIKEGYEDMPFLRQLNENGIEAAIASPYDVFGALAARFAMNFAHQVDLAVDAGTPADLVTLFQRTVEALKQESAEVRRMLPELNEFVLAGNVNLKTCKKP